MYIDFIKQKENENYVWYKFETSVIDANSSNNSIKMVYGIFYFDKISDTNSESLKIVEDESDEFLVKSRRIRLACLRTMYDCKQANEYPEKISKAFGG